MDRPMVARYPWKVGNATTGPVILLAIINSVGRQVSGEQIPDRLLDFGMLLTPDHAARIVKKGLSKIFGWVEWFGNLGATFIGVAFIFKIIKYILSSIINALSIREAVGCNICILAGLWSAATHLVIQKNVNKNQQRPGDGALPLIRV